VLPWAVGGAVLACFFALVRESYFIRAYSDCYNWLEFAKNFGREFTRSRWPYGFPLFLRGALAVAGPYRVFLVNLPVMLALFALTAWFGTLLRRDDGAGEGAVALPAGWAFLSVWIPVLAADAASFTRYLNPYRDPLSYVLVVFSAVLFVRSLAKRRTWGVATAGAVLGLASSVREPSVFMAVPFLAYGLWTWAGAKEEIPLWKTAGAFALGLAAALVPLLVQTYLTTHQVLLPPQASLESQVVPGVHFKREVFAPTGYAAWVHYTKHELWLLLLAAAGLVAAVRRRNRLVLALAVPAAVMYAAFYTFYWTFVIRYFYVAVLFLVLVAGYGVQTFLGWLCERWPRRGRMAGWVLLAAGACAAGGRLLASRWDFQPHQVPQAKAFAAAFGEVCPDASEVFAPRFLCEWIDWFMPYPSHPMPSPGPTGEGRSAFLRAELGPRLERGERLVAAVWDGEETAEGLDDPFLRRAFDRIPAGVLDPVPYCAHDYARKPIHFYRIAPWSRHRTELAWPAPSGERYWYMLDTGDPAEAEAAPIEVSVDDVRQPGTVAHGGAQVGAGLPREGGGEGTAVAESAGLLPRDMRVAAGSLDEPVTLDFRFYSAFDHRWRLRGEVLPADERFHIGPRVPSAVEVEIPVPWPERGGAVLEWDVLSSCKIRGGFVEVGAYEDGRRLAGVRMPADRRVAKLVVPLPDDPERDVRTVRLEVEDRPAPENPDEPPPGIELYQVRIHRRPAAYPVEIRFDGKGDAIHAFEGFHPAEGRGSGAFRWTDGAAEAAVYAPVGSGRDVELRIAYSTAGVPADANADGELRVSWDGDAVEGTIERTDEGGKVFIWSAVLPAERVGAETPHRLRMESPPWKPADYGSRDSRTLGVGVRRIELAEAGEGTVEAQGAAGKSSP
jgi:hypothetical protein